MMTLPEPLTRRIEAIAEREGRKPEELMQALLDEYEARHTDEQVQADSKHPEDANPDQVIEAFIGAFDDEVSDLSVTVRETIRQRFEQSDDRSA